MGPSPHGRRPRISPDRSSDRNAVGRARHRAVATIGSAWNPAGIMAFSALIGTGVGHESRSCKRWSDGRVDVPPLYNTPPARTGAAGKAAWAPRAHQDTATQSARMLGEGAFREADREGPAADRPCRPGP